MPAIRAGSRALGVLLALWVLVAPGAAAQVYTFTDEQGNIHFADHRPHAGYERYRPKPLRPTPQTRPLVVASTDWDPLIRRAGAEYRVPPGLIKAVIHVESAFDPAAISRRGASGLMQLMPHTARELGVSDPFDPDQNIRGGTRYLEQLMRHYTDLRHALAAYNAGPKVVGRYGGVPPYRETRSYVRRVIGLYHRYQTELR